MQIQNWKWLQPRKRRAHLGYVEATRNHHPDETDSAVVRDRIEVVTFPGTQPADAVTCQHGSHKGARGGKSPGTDGTLRALLP